MKYFKHWAESYDGEEGTVYFEVDDEVVTRQVEIYPNQTLWMSQQDAKDPKFEIADQPFGYLDLGEDNEISRKAFEEMWERAHLN